MTGFPPHQAVYDGTSPSLCGVVLDSELAAWADALPSIPFVVDPTLTDGVVQMRQGNRVVAELRNVHVCRRWAGDQTSCPFVDCCQVLVDAAADLDARFGRGFSAGGAYAEGPEIPGDEDFTAARSIIAALEAQR